MKYVYSILLVFIQVSAMAFSATINGVIINDSGSFVPYVKIIMVGKTNPSIIDSTVSDSTGKFAFTQLTAGIYGLTYISDKYYLDSSTVIVPSDSITVTKTLKTLPGGTVHVGNDSGVWLAKDNPHILAGDVNVASSLAISPGCIVRSHQNTINVGGTLLIGNDDSVAVEIDSTNIASNSASSIIELHKVNIDPAGIKIPKAKKVVLSSMNLSYNTNAYGTHAISCDTFVLRSSQVAGYDEYGYTMGHWFLKAMTSLNVNGNSIFLSGNKIYHLILSLNGNDSVINNLIYNSSDETSFGGGGGAGGLCVQGKETLLHNNISHLMCGSIDSTNISTIRISGNIIGKFHVTYQITSQLYSSPLTCNIIDTLGYTPIFGLLQKVQKNSNGDSCDLWFNIRADPLLSNDQITLVAGSPAVKAACDGTNIGIYQGAAVAVRPQTIGQRHIKSDAATIKKIVRMNSNTSGVVYNVTGQKINCKRAAKLNGVGFYITVSPP